MIPLPYRLLGILALVLGLFMSGYFYGRHAQGIKDDSKIASERLTWNQAVAAGQKEKADAIEANDQLKTKLEIQHANANGALNILLDTPAGRLQLPATCLSATANSEVQSAGGSTVSTPGTQRTADAAQAALDDFTRGMEADAAEWSRALNACQVVMQWARAQ